MSRVIWIGLIIFLGASITSCNDASSPTEPSPASGAWTLLSQDAQITKFWGISPQSIYGVGRGGTIFHYDGSGWSPQASGVLDNLKDVWGVNDRSVFAVGENERILHYDGNAWTPMSKPDDGTSSIYAIWGSSESNVFVSLGSVIFRYTSGAWKMETGLVGKFNSIWGTSGDDVFAVGLKGYYDTRTSLIFHFDGHTWKSIETGTTEELLLVWGTGSRNVYAAGVDGILLHYDGNTWKREVSGATRIIQMWGSPNDVFAMDSEGGAIYHYDGQSWSSLVPPRLGHQFDAAWGTSGTEGFASNIEEALFAFNGGSLSTLVENKGFITGIWAASENEIYATSQSGKIVRYLDGKWEAVYQGNQYLAGIWGNASNDVFAVGSTVTILHYDGNSWTPEVSGSSASLNAVWGSSPTNVVAVGNNGVILHFDGSSWTSEVSGSTAPLSAVWGSDATDVFAVSLAGTILHLDGTGWHSQPVDFSDRESPYLQCIWGSSKNDVFCAGSQHTKSELDYGFMLHYDGASWTLMHKEYSWNGVTAIWGRAGNDVFAVGTYDRVRHYDGQTWSPEGAIHWLGYLSAVSGAGGRVFAGGQNGIVLQYDLE